MESSQVPASAPEPESTASGSSATTESQRNPPATVVSGVDRQSQQPTTRPTGMNRPMVPDTVRQALTPSQLELLYEAMGEQQGGFHGFPGPSNFDSMPPPRFPNAESHMCCSLGTFRLPLWGDKTTMVRVCQATGTPAMQEGQSCRDRRISEGFLFRSDDEDRIHRQQVEELRRRQRQQNQPSTQGDAAETQETISGPAMVQDEITGQMRPSNAQGPVQRLTDDFSPGPGFQPFPMRSDMPMTLREEALREQSFEYGGGGLGRMPPHVQVQRACECQRSERIEEHARRRVGIRGAILRRAIRYAFPLHRLSLTTYMLLALQERIGNVSRGVTETTIEQNSFTFEYAPPSPTSEAGANLQRDPTLVSDLPTAVTVHDCFFHARLAAQCASVSLRKAMPAADCRVSTCFTRHCPVCKTDIVTGAQETRREAGDQQCSAAAMPVMWRAGEPDYSPPGWGSDDEFEGIGIPGFGPRPGRSQPDVLAAAAESRFNAPSESAGMVRDDVTGQMRPAAAQAWSCFLFI
eukprot:582992-Hanusia_phi.AAC.8